MARTVLVVLMAVLVLMATVSEARYLPTRGDDSRMEEIRELLREILERTADTSSTTGARTGGYGFDKRLIYKRSVVGADTVQAAPASSANAERMVPLFNLAQ